jgi:glycopeptide antibiotics resistance protein
LEQELISIAQAALKTEWKRVKKGEPTFRIAKYITIFILICGLLLMAFSVLRTNKKMEGSQNGTEIIIENKERSNNSIQQTR